MTMESYGHLKNISHRPWFIAAFLTWLIAFFEYLIQVTNNRVSCQLMNVGQLKVLQEVITLTVMVPFAWKHLKEKRALD